MKQSFLIAALFIGFFLFGLSIGHLRGYELAKQEPVLLHYFWLDENNYLWRGVMPVTDGMIVDVNEFKKESLDIADAQPKPGEQQSVKQ